MESEAAGELHVVEQGECLSSLTQLYGFSDYRQIYYHPNNSELRRKRPNPNVLYPGDEVFIAAKELKPYVLSVFPPSASAIARGSETSSVTGRVTPRIVSSPVTR